MRRKGIKAARQGKSARGRSAGGAGNRGNDSGSCCQHTGIVQCNAPRCRGAIYAIRANTNNAPRRRTGRAAAYRMNSIQKNGNRTPTGAGIDFQKQRKKQPRTGTRPDANALKTGRNAPKTGAAGQNLHEWGDWLYIGRTKNDGYGPDFYSSTGPAGSHAGGRSRT